MPDEATVRHAIDRYGILRSFPTIDLQKQKVGVFGRLVKFDTALQSGERKRWKLLKAGVARNRPSGGSCRSIFGSAILARRAALKDEQSLRAGWGPSASGQKPPLATHPDSGHPDDVV